MPAPSHAAASFESRWADRGRVRVSAAPSSRPSLLSGRLTRSVVAIHRQRHIRPATRADVRQYAPERTQPAAADLDPAPRTGLVLGVVRLITAPHRDTVDWRSRR